jgi:ABC-type transport system involved in cytochrome c biogenesis permease component
VYIIEVMMLVTGLIGPIFLALSMFPVGLKPLITWGTSFLTLGFCKICFSLISGLSSLAMVLSGPDNIDMLVTAIVLGLLAPVLSFSIASGSGIQALSTISYSAQPFRIGTGITPYSPESLSRDNGGKKNSNSNSSVD